MKFSDLIFVSHAAGIGGVHATTFFPNGYGASVIKTPFSYGGKEGLYELAVMKGTAENNKLCYDTELTNDVIGHLSEDDVSDYLVKIEALDA